MSRGARPVGGSPRFPSVLLQTTPTCQSAVRPLIDQENFPLPPSREEGGALMLNSTWPWTVVRQCRMLKCSRQTSARALQALARPVHGACSYLREPALAHHYFDGDAAYARD